MKSAIFLVRFLMQVILNVYCKSVDDLFNQLVFINVMHEGIYIDKFYFDFHSDFVSYFLLIFRKKALTPKKGGEMRSK